jgi:hypothetical protein
MFIRSLDGFVWPNHLKSKNLVQVYLKVNVMHRHMLYILTGPDHSYCVFLTVHFAILYVIGPDMSNSFPFILFCLIVLKDLFVFYWPHWVSLFSCWSSFVSMCLEF